MVNGEIGPLFITPVGDPNKHLEDNDGQAMLMGTGRSSGLKWFLRTEDDGATWHLRSKDSKKYLEETQGTFYGFVHRFSSKPAPKTAWIVAPAGNGAFYFTGALGRMLEVQDGNLISGEASKAGDANKMWKLRKCDTAEPVTVLEAQEDPLAAALSNAQHLLDVADAAEKSLAEVLTINGVILHQLVDEQWASQPEPVRVDVIYDGVEKMFYAAALAPTGDCTFRTYITPEDKERYVAAEETYHTWWVQDQHSEELVAWSMMFNSAEEASSLSGAVHNAANGTLTPPSGGEDALAQDLGPAESESSYGTMKTDFLAMRRSLFETFKNDIATTKIDITRAIKPEVL